MTNKNEYSELIGKCQIIWDKYWWVFSVGIGLILGFNHLYGGERLRVLKCNGLNNIAYNTNTGRLWEYDSFKESYVLKDLTESKSKTTGGAYWNSFRSEDSKIESFFVNGNLKIRKVSKLYSSMVGSQSPLPGGSRNSYTKVDETVVYDAKKEKDVYSVKKNGSSFTCKLHRNYKL